MGWTAKKRASGRHQRQQQLTASTGDKGDGIGSSRLSSTGSGSAHAGSAHAPQLVWMETTPQHFDNGHAYKGCQAAPATPMDFSLPWPRELDLLCGGASGGAEFLVC